MYIGNGREDEYIQMNILVVIDMQNDFITGVLGTAQAEVIVPQMTAFIRSHPGEVVYTMDTHDENYLETLEGKKLPVVHCLEHSHGWEVPTTIQEALDEKKARRIIKHTFGAEQLPGVLNDTFKGNIDSITLIGVCTDICVISNALLLKAYFPDIPIRVQAALCAGATPEGHERALQAMQSCHIDIIE